MATTTNLGLTKYHASKVKDNAGALPANLDILDAAKGLETICFFVAGVQTAAALKAAALVGVAGTIVDVRAKVLTAPTGATLIVDVNKNGTTIFTTQAARPTIAISGTASTTTAPAVTAVAAGDHLSVDVDQIGSSVAGSDLMVSVTIKRNVTT